MALKQLYVRSLGYSKQQLADSISTLCYAFARPT